MDKNLQANVEAIATDVRYWAEGRAPSECANLLGWCARASAELFKQLKEEGFEAEIHAWTSPRDEASHVFVVVDDHVVDVTATQFKEFAEEPVLIIHQKEAQAYEFYQSDKVFHSVQELLSWQKKSRWPGHQLAFI